MKFKFRILSLLILISIVATSLSSCFFFDVVSSSSGKDGNGGNTTINTGDIKNHEIYINSSSEETVLATSKALMSSVSIYTEASAGSGVIFKLNADKGEAYILTNYHVVYNAKKQVVCNDIKLCLYGMEMINYAMDAEYLGGTMEFDLAVLKITGSPVLMSSNAIACEFADSNKIAVLETAIAVGNANGEGISATLGRVNVDSEQIDILGADERTSLENFRVLRTDAAVNSGNSGGGLFNSKGEVIGIVNAKSIDSKVDNIGYAIPSNVAKYIAENIIYYCDGHNGIHSAYQCMLGISVQVSELYTEYDNETGILHKKEKIKIVEIKEDSAAEKGTIVKTEEDSAEDDVKKGLAVDDIINSITIDGTKYEVSRIFHVVDAMLNARVGSDVTVNVTRAGETKDVKIILTENDIEEADESLYKK